MAAHAGIVFFDGRPATARRAALVAGLQPLAPDGVSIWSGAGIAMAHGAFHVWTGEREAQQPVRSPRGLVVAFDGRLDNRDDLLLRLGPPAGGDPSDAALAAAMFERFGPDGLRSLIGEWSVAIWDPHHRTLHLARDYIGVRPLYYYRDAVSVLWSTNLGELALRADCVNALSDKFVAAFMTIRLLNGTTPYEPIRMVPASKCLTFADGGTETCERYWQLEPATIRYRDRRQYEEQLRALWSDAVGTRLRSEGIVWAELSGGYDSSSVVCMADRLIRSGRVAAAGVQPVSHVTLETPEGDERRFIAEVEARIGVQSEILGAEAHQHDIDAEWDWVTPHMTRGVSLATSHLARDRGGRVLLSGTPGDLIMCCKPDNSVAVLDDLRSGHLLRALGEMRRWSRATRKPIVEILSQLRARSSAAAIVRAFDTRPDIESTVELLTPRLREVALDDRSELTRAVSRIRASRREMAAALLSNSYGARLNIPERPPGAIYAYPFTHRPLVEFVMAIPAGELSAPGEIRSLMRRAFAGLVPPRILRRFSKGHYAPFLLRNARVQATAMRPVDRLEVVRRGWVDPVRLDAAIRTLVDGGGTGGDVGQVLRLEEWLISRARRAPAAIPQRKEVRSHEVLNA